MIEKLRRSIELYKQNPRMIILFDIVCFLYGFPLWLISDGIIKLIQNNIYGISGVIGGIIWYVFLFAFEKINKTKT